MPRILVLFLALLFSLSLTSHAASIYLKIAGVEGGASASDYVGWCEVESVGELFSVPTSSSESGASGAAELQPVYVHKFLDEATPYLHEFVASQNTIERVQLAFTQISSEGKQEEFFTITMETVRVVSVALSQDEDSGDVPIETVGFSPLVITWKNLEGNIETSYTTSKGLTSRKQ